MDKTTNRQTARSAFASKWLDREVGNYRVEKLLSQHESRQTVSLKAITKETNKPVVLKVFGSFSEMSKKEFEKEIAAYKKLKNKSRHGVLMPVEAFEAENDYFIVTEYKNGEDLRKWLKKNPKMTEILDIFARIAESIDYIHENRIIHRDMKPENVVYEVLGERITPYLTDFGISVTLSNTTSSFVTKHATGTTRYMAPEFFAKKDDKMTKAVDIYAFGVMLYEALEKRHPATGDKEHEIIAQIVSGVLPVPENTIKWLGENAGFILTKALSKNPEDRPKTATEIISQMESQYIKCIGNTYGEYVVEEYIGRGPYGASYKAFDINNRNKKVALKLLSVPQAFLPEISELKSLERNKGVLPIIDSGYENGALYLVSEYLNAHNLRNVFSLGCMKLQDILKIVKPLSETLDYLHEKAIIHRDLKPENILLRKNRADGSLQPFVNGHGISKVTGTTTGLNSNSNVPLANLNYLAPEILENKQPSFAADVYSLGVIIFEAVEGKTPFDARSLPDLIKQKLDAYVPVPENLLKNGGVRAARVLLRSLDVIPEKRQSSACDLVSQLEDAIKNQAVTDKGIFVEPWIKSRKLISDFKKNSYAFWVSGLLLVFIFWGIFSSISARLRPPPTADTTPAPTASAPVDATPTVAAISTLTPPSVIPAPTFVLSDQCRLAIDSLDHDYIVPGDLLLEDVYVKYFRSDPDYNDLYAIAYYNNRKILEGYSQYHVIDPVRLDVKRDWKIFIPPQEWIRNYKEFPATIPQTARAETPSKLYISGSSILAHLSAQISRCSVKTIGIELIQSDSSNTVSGLQDLCQSKVDLFGANKEMDPKSSCVELEKFEVGKYAMVIFINKDNPNADDIQKNPMTPEELIGLLIDVDSWDDIRGPWEDSGDVDRFYPSLESGGFEIVKDGIFPDRIVDDVPGLIVSNDSQLLLDAVAENANAVGIVDYASYVSFDNKNQLIAIPVNGVYASSAITGTDLRYPLMTTLYLYADKNAYENNVTLQNFINYYLSHELDYLEEFGYFYPSRNGYRGNRDTVP